MQLSHNAMRLKLGFDQKVLVLIAMRLCSSPIPHMLAKRMLLLLLYFTIVSIRLLIDN